VVDAHLHVWHAVSHATPWRPGWARHAHGPRFQVEDATRAMEGAGVARAILIPAAWDVRGNELVEEAARRFPERFAAFPVADLRSPLDAAALRSWMERPGVLGLRQMFPPGVRSRLEDGSADWLWPAAEAAGVPLMLWMPGQLRHLGPILRRHPRLRVTLDHLNLGMGPTSSERATALRELCALADLPNLAVKASALPCLAPEETYPYPSAQRLVRQVVDAFGARRVFWGSDLGRLPCSYRQAVSMVLEGSAGLSEGEVALVMGQAILEWLGWGPQTASEAPAPGR